jgi:hypothetical protein
MQHGRLTGELWGKPGCLDHLRERSADLQGHEAILPWRLLLLDSMSVIDIVHDADPSLLRGGHM